MRQLKKDRKGSVAAIGILVLAITIAVGAVVGLATVALSKDVFDDMDLGHAELGDSAAHNASALALNTSMTSTTNIIYSSWPLSGLSVLAGFGALALGMFLTYLGVGGRR